MNITPITFLMDDAEIKALLVQHDRSSALEERKEYAAEPYRLNCIWTHKGTVYCIRRCIGYPIPEDNGYCGITFPLDETHKEEAARIIRAFLEGGTTNFLFGEFQDLNLHSS